MELKGKVKTGFGTGGFWVNKIVNIFRERYKTELFLGTLNVELENEYILETDEKILPEEYGGDFDVLVKKCNILGNTGYILRPALNNKKGRTPPFNNN